MAQLSQELFGIVAANHVMRHRDPDRGGRLSAALGPVNSRSNRARMTGRMVDSWVITTSGSMSINRTPSRTAGGTR